MLRNLHIKNLALIREVDIEFSEGLNILTGETGSGKSIIVDSVGLALGGRVQRELAGEDGRPAIIELVFEIEDEVSLGALRGLDVEPEDGVILISRKIQDGRSTMRINGQTRTQAEVRSCAAHLLEIHGQSEHQKLLGAEKQMELLDAYGKQENAEAREKVRSDYRRWSELRRELLKGELGQEERARQISFLEYEVREIDDAHLTCGEDEELEKAYRVLSNARRIAEAVEAAHAATGYDSSEGAGEQIGLAVRKLENVSEYDARLEALCEQLGEIDSLLNDFNRELADYADDLDSGTGTLEETEERLNLINHLKSKYGRTIEAILEGKEERVSRLSALNSYEENRERLKKEAEAAESELAASCKVLTEIRKRTAVSFIKEASQQFAELNFARADFSIEFRSLPEYTSSGKDGIEFVIATNPGDPRKPLRNVVSGGELSRLMLGIRTMFADVDSIGTIIFDEIDTGISGRTAQKAAEKLARAAADRQVICITHLPQIAAMADAHYGITKAVEDEAAITNIEHLSPEDSVLELARLIGGAEITENTLKSAREMKEMCRQFRHHDL